MQADILDLGELNNQFDIVESAGVIHHMENPIKGWRVLVDCIKPGGLMMLGLYSELARQHIVNMREDISNLGIGPSDTEMKLFRSNLIDLDSEDLKVIKFSPDFFNLSEWRDLLFHVQEHRFTLLQISKYLGELGLYFCGFEPINQ